MYTLHSPQNAASCWAQLLNWITFALPQSWGSTSGDVIGCQPAATPLPLPRAPMEKVSSPQAYFKKCLAFFFSICVYICLLLSFRPSTFFSKWVWQCVCGATFISDLSTSPCHISWDMWDGCSITLGGHSLHSHRLKTHMTLHRHSCFICLGKLLVSFVRLQRLNLDKVGYT